MRAIEVNNNPVKKILHLSNWDLFEICFLIFKILLSVVHIIQNT